MANSISVNAMVFLSNRINNATLVRLISFAIALMWAYAAISKLADYRQSRSEMLAQLFAPPVALVLVWLVPGLELLIAIGLLFGRSRLSALWASIALLLLFSAYITLAITGVLGRTPCSCGGIIGKMGYGKHLLFNLLFAGLAGWAIALERDRRTVHGWLHHWERRSGKT